ncbi:MAG: 30S ribosomal protein S6 [Anaerolineales bacterium]|nr:30S ribosomal protein S6 [Anaerolineales bacterium]
MRDYELVFIVPPDVQDDDLTAVTSQVQSFIEREGGQVQKTDMWGMRRLAYPINNHWEGQYVLMHVALDPARVSSFERDLRLAEKVIRHLVVLREE